MRKVILGFAAGVLCTYVVSRVFDELPLPSTEHFDNSASLSSSVSGPVREISPSDPMPTARGVTPAPQSAEAVPNNSDFPEDLTLFAMGERSGVTPTELLRAVSDEDLRAMEGRAQALVVRNQEQLDPELLLNIVSAELRRREQIARWADAPPPAQPIVLPLEFSRMLENAGIRDMHERLQREPVDPAWSRPMEMNLKSLIASQPELLGRYGSPTIHCRTSGCEITFVAYGIDTAARAADPGNPAIRPENTFQGDFFDAFQDLREEPLLEGQLDLAMFGSPPIYVQDGVTTILIHVGRVEDLEGTPGIDRN